MTRAVSAAIQDSRLVHHRRDCARQQQDHRQERQDQGHQGHVRAPLHQEHVQDVHSHL